MQVSKNPNVVTDAYRLWCCSSETTQCVTASCPEEVQVTHKRKQDQVTKVFRQELVKQLHLLEEPYFIRICLSHAMSCKSRGRSNTNLL